MSYIVSDFSKVVEVPQAGIRREEDSEELPAYLRDELDSILITENCIKARVQGLAKEINNHFTEKKLHCVVVLSGAIVFFADLIRALSRYGFKITYSLVKVASYERTESSGHVTLDLDVGFFDGKEVMIVEDIVDTGLTLSYLKNHLLKKKNAGSVKVCALFDKPERREVKIRIDFLGFTVPNRFLVGYGLDYEQHFRDLPFVAIKDEGR